jgi:hypothetical protein
MNFYLQKFEIRGFIKRLFRIENWEEFFPTSLHEILLKLNESDTFFTESKIILINKYISDKRNPKVHFIFKKIFGEESDSSILDTLSVAESKNSIFQKEIFKINREIQDTSSLSGKILLGKNYKKIFQKGKRVCFENLVNSINTFDLKEAHINEIIMLIEVYDFKDNKTYLSTKTNSLFPEQVSNYFHNWIKTKNSISHFKSCLNIFKKSQLLSKLFYIEIPQLVDKIAKISDQNKINTLNKIKKEINKKYSEKLLLSSNTYMNVSFTRESFTSWLDKAINNMDTAMQPKDLVKIYTIYYFNNNRSLLKNKTRRLYFLNKLSFCLNRDSNKYKGVLKTISDEKETLK